MQTKQQNLLACKSRMCKIWQHEARKRYKAFLNYNSKDRPFVEKIRKQLEADYGIRSFIDLHMERGKHVLHEITDALRNSDNAIVFLEPNKIGKHQQTEIEIAHNRERDRLMGVIPVFLPGVAPDDVRGWPGVSNDWPAFYEWFLTLSYCDFRDTKIWAPPRARRTGPGCSGLGHSPSVGCRPLIRERA